MFTRTMNTLNKCSICGNKEFTFLFKSKDRMMGFSGEFGIVRCNRCKAWLLSPRPSDKQLAGYYPKSNYYAYTETKGGFFTILRSYLISHYYSPTIFSNLISIIIHAVPALPSKRGGKVLDIGCGTGDTLVQLKALGFDVYGMDMDANAVRLAKQKGVTHVQIGRYKDLKNYKDNYFDVIRMYHVIEHLDDPGLCMSLLYKKLKKGGELIIGTPNPSSMVARLFGSYWYNLDSPRHLVLLSPKNLQSIGERQKFTVGKIDFCSAGGFIGSIQYMLEEKFGVRWDLIHTLWIVLCTYPFEWIIDKFHTGDVYVARFYK